MQLGKSRAASSPGVDQAQTRESSKFRLMSPWGGCISSSKDPPRFFRQDSSTNIPFIKPHPEPYPTIQKSKGEVSASHEGSIRAGGCLELVEAEGQEDTKGRVSMSREEVLEDENTID